MSRLAFVLVAAAFLAPTVLGQGREDTQGAYSAVAMGTGGGVGGKSMQFDFRISTCTTDEEVDQLAALLKEKGPDGLRRAMEKLNVGRIRPTSSVGNQIAVARKRQDGSNTVITVTARQMPFIELYRNGRTTDYPSGFLQVTLDEKSQGAGQIMAAAKIRFDKKKGHYEFESYGNQYIKAVNVLP